jgi:hypothetical protein
MTEEAYCEKNPNTEGCALVVTTPTPNLPTTCGDEKISVNETMMSYGVGIPGGIRWNFTLNESQVACKENCMFVHEWPISDT